MRPSRARTVGAAERSGRLLEVEEGRRKESMKHVVWI